MFLAAFPSELAIARRCWSDAVVDSWGRDVVLHARDLEREETLALHRASRRGQCRHTSERNDGPALRVLFGGVPVGGLEPRPVAARCYSWPAPFWVASPRRPYSPITTGSPIIAIQIMANQARQNALNEYALEYASGPAHLLWLALARMSPLTTVLATFGLLAGSYRPRCRRSGDSARTSCSRG